MLRSIEGNFDNPDVHKLLVKHFIELRSVSPEGSAHVLDINGLKHSSIKFWSLWENDVLMGSGALKVLNKVDMALHVLQKILAQNEQLEHGHHLIAEAYIRNLKFDLAFEHHLRAHQISPQNAMNDYLLGVDYIWKGDNTNAEKHLTNAIKLNPKFTKAFFALSRIKKMTPQHDVCKAVLALNKHPDLSPEDLIFTEFTLFKIYSYFK